MPVRRSASKFPAQGAGQNSIWSHMEPNQYQNHVLGKCGFRQEAMPCRPSWILPDKKPMCSGVGCLRRFFPGKMQPPDFGHANQAKCSTLFGHFFTKNDQTCSGAAFFAVISDETCPGSVEYLGSHQIFKNQILLRAVIQGWGKGV